MIKATGPIGKLLLELDIIEAVNWSMCNATACKRQNRLDFKCDHQKNKLDQ